MNPQKLIKILEGKLKTSPENHRLKERLADLLLKQGKLSRSETLFTEALKKNPNSKNAIWGLSRISWKKRRYEEACSYLNVLSNLSENELNKEQALLFAKVLSHLKRFQDALVWLERAINLDVSVLHSEMRLLKMLQYNLNLKQNALHLNQPRIAMGQVFDDEEKHYIVIEISQLLSQAMSQSSPISISEDKRREATHQQQELEHALDEDVLSFEEIQGLNSVKTKLVKELVFPLNNPSILSANGKTSPPKILLYGPPGCGKTLLCKALAYKSQLTFFALSPGDFLDLSFEECESRLQSLILQAKHHAPCVIFVDEASWLLHPEIKGDELGYIYRSNLFRYLMFLLNNHLKLNSQVGVLMTSNTPWLIDASFLGESGLNKQIYLSAPSFRRKIEILESLVAHKHNNGSPLLRPSDIDCVKVLHALSKICLSGADLNQLLENALADTLFENLAQEDLSKDPQPINTEYLIKVGKEMRQKAYPVNLWLDKANEKLKPSKSPLNFMWKQMKAEEREANK